MDKKVTKALRLPVPLVRRIERWTKEEGSTFSQFIRVALIRELRAKEHEQDQLSKR